MLASEVGMAPQSTHQGERGQGFVEYALIIAFVTIVVILILAVFGEGVAGLYNYVLGQI